MTFSTIYPIIHVHQCTTKERYHIKPFKVKQLSGTIFVKCGICIILKLSKKTTITVFYDFEFISMVLTNFNNKIQLFYFF